MGERVHMRKRAPQERAKNFEEVALGYSPEEALKEAERCLLCKNPLCVKGCPVEIDIPGFIKENREGRFLLALKKNKRDQSSSRYLWKSVSTRDTM